MSIFVILNCVSDKSRWYLEIWVFFFFEFCEHLRLWGTKANPNKKHIDSQIAP